ncbi:MAG: cytochrome C [Gallionella sp.]|nr:cytochrome C [Gallionella sp.]
MMKMIKQLVIAIGLMLPMICAHAEVDKRARDLAASCAACHGTNGKSAGGFPVLASLDKGYFVAQMKDFKSGARPATVMHQMSKGFTDEEFELMGGFFAAQKR